MKKAFYLAFLIASFGFADEGSPKKILMLVVSSRTHPAYEKLEDIWRSYIHSDPERVEALFLRSDPNLPVRYEIRGDVLWARTIDEIWPGILCKTLLAIEHTLPRIDEFDYFIRTNLSSFFVLPRLYDFLATLPKQRCYCGVEGTFDGYGSYVSGAGMILSTDLAKLLVEEQDQIPRRETFWDDVVVGKFFSDRKVPIIQAPRIDIPTVSAWLELKKDILFERTEVYHFRLKNHDESIRAIDEVYVHSEIANLFY